jgi:tetratricopeptide (TPR) repeat protein
VIRWLLLAALLALSACSAAPFRSGSAASAPASQPTKRPAGSGPVIRPSTGEQVYEPGPERQEVIEEGPPVVAEPPAPRPRPKRPPATLSPASQALVAQAQAQRKKGDLPGASVTLDRALRIEPNNPLLWIEMGELRMDQRNYAQAENMGRKALAMSVGDDTTQSQAWVLIAQSLRARGRNSEAEEAMQRAREATPR